MMNFFQFPAGTWNLPAESSQTLTGEEDACMQLHKVPTCLLRLSTSKRVCKSVCKACTLVCSFTRCKPAF